MGASSGLSPHDVRETILTFRDLLRSHQAVVNRLNVYPVPDGDTGTNMALTLESVARELEGADGSDMASVCKAISHGSLMGARGNSGVILSQLLRGLAERFREVEQVTLPELAEALANADVLAREAVGRPVEGTILTVARAAAEGAAAAVAEETTFSDAVATVHRFASEALEGTPELLPQLKQAGVVDAGGAGFLLLIDALAYVVSDTPLPEAPELPDVDVEVEGHEPTALEELRYEVMYLLEAPDETIKAFKEVWAGIGDSIVVVGGDGLYNCHIHTDDIGAAIEAALDAGRPREIRVTDLLEQVDEERWVREHEPAPEDAASEEGHTTSVIAVVTGEGVGRIFRSLGVSRQVKGGQSMNPSTEQLLEAVESLEAAEVVILPNNKNIRAVAEQVDELTNKTVRVVPTNSIVEGFAALLSFDPGAGADDNASAMVASASNVIAGEVTQAVRATVVEAGEIAEGDWIGLSRSGILSIAGSLTDATCKLVAALFEEDRHELVTLIEGEGSSAGDTRKVTQWLHETYPEVAVEVHHGGQPLYPYLVGIE